MKEINTTTIIGMGALGMLFANQIVSTLGMEAVTFAADPDRVEKYSNMSFSINGKPCRFQITSFSECRPADLVIVAVKYNSLLSALDAMQNCINPDTTIISVMNGITSEEIIGKHYGYEKIIYCIAQGMDAVKFGGELNYTQPGELRIGIREPINPNHNKPMDASPSILSADRSRLNQLIKFLDRTNISYTVETDIIHRLWGKFMFNVGLNQACMAFETNYGGLLVSKEAFDTMGKAMKEVMLIANAEGIPLTQEDYDSYIELLHVLSPDGMPSMRQDGIAHRPSEVEMFSGTVRRIAAKHGIDVPVNDWLYHKIKDIEAENIL